MTIDLGQLYHVAYVLIKAGNSPRPATWILEKSRDNGKTFEPWQYFARTPQECDSNFGAGSLGPITSDDTVICDTQFSGFTPFEGGEIMVLLLKDRPSKANFFTSAVLQEWTQATHVRLRLVKANTLLGHLMVQDPTVTRRFFYSLQRHLHTVVAVSATGTRTVAIFWTRRITTGGYAGANTTRREPAAKCARPTSPRKNGSKPPTPPASSARPATATSTRKSASTMPRLTSRVSSLPLDICRPVDLC